MIITIGLAMIVRNGADLMRRALDPLCQHVDEVSIVLGGHSKDDTAAIAVEYATAVDNGNGLPIDDRGRLMDFSAARNRALDNLTTDWVVMVDADDQWSGGENLRLVVEMAEENEAVFVFVPYGLQSSNFAQIRIFKRDAGRYEGPVHELWHPNDPKASAAQTDLVDVQQVRSDGLAEGRYRHNIAIAEEHLARSESPTPRMLTHLVQDYFLIDRYETALRYADQYIEVYHANGYDMPDELFYVHYRRWMILMKQGEYEPALQAAMSTLACRNYGQAWALVAEAANHVATEATNPGGMYQLALLAADKALEAGHLRTSFPLLRQHVTVAPYHIKAQANLKLGRIREAKSAVELGLQLDPENSEMIKLADVIKTEMRTI